MQTPRALFILGMHRSGTSALSGAIASAGVYFGDDLLEAEAGVNDKGFWEHRELVRLNEALLAHAELKWFTPVAVDALSAVCEAPELAGPLFDQARSFAETAQRPVFGCNQGPAALSVGTVLAKSVCARRSRLLRHSLVAPSGRSSGIIAAA